MEAILCAIFFFSGASALIFELLWFQLTGLTFGNSVWATSLTLASFMAGLALGSGLVGFKGHKIKSPIRFYALLEIIIGVSGFLLVLLLPNLTKIFVPVYRALLGHDFLLNSFKTITSFCLMAAPACAMGATLPVLVNALMSYSKHNNPDFGRTLGILYGWNTFGATAGVIGGELFLVKWLGIRGAGLLAACFNLLAAAAAAWVYRKKKKDPETFSRKGFWTSQSFSLSKLLAAGFLSGFTVLALEVTWFRFMLLFFSATTLNFSLMLATVLLGISLGGMAASKWFRVQPDAHRFLTALLVFNGMLVVLLYTNFGALHGLIETLNDHIKILFLSLFLIFPVSFFSGVIFTMLGKALHKEMTSETQAAGLLTLANTFGGMIGSLAAGFIFIPYLGVEKSFFLFALCYGVMALLALPKEQSAMLKKKLSLAHAVLAAYVASLLFFPFGFMDSRYLKIPYERYSLNGETRVAAREGVVETIQYLESDLLGKPHYYRLVTNSHTMSGAWMGARRYMKLFVYWPIAVNPGIKNVLLICYGCGMTAKAMTDTKSFENIEIVDISREIVEEGRVVFPDPRENPVHDPRVKVHIEDGRFFLLTRQRQFDLITAEPPPPKNKGIVNLYTREYFQLIHDRLSAGGIVTYWLPVYQLSTAETRSILKAFNNVFPENSLWAGSGLEWMMVGVKDPVKPVTEVDFARQWQDPVVAPELRTLGFESPEQLGAFFIADGQRLKDWLADAPPLADNYPHLLSSRLTSEPGDIAAYIDFMNSPASGANFLNSESMAKLWPESLREKTTPYFAVSPVINEILISTSIWGRYKNINYLHACIHNPLLENYLPLVLGSDNDAQRIMTTVQEENPGQRFEVPATFIHLAAAALKKKQYLPAERYLHMMNDYLSRGNLLDDYSRFNYCTLRMYLLFIAGEKALAKQVGNEYLDSLERRQGKGARDKVNSEFGRYLDWLEQTLKNLKPG
ncbi:MAG: spermidine synthase [Acidobacteriota bacterium]|nr:spermidine synthase [Acidobacteriota bacterium]